MVPDPNADPSGDRPTREGVRARLDRVTDPELDRSIVALGYVDEIAVCDVGDRARVTVRFTLPTAWCSPAFAWMMVSDARESVAALPGVESVRVELREHVHEREITEGVNEGRPFGEVFPDADGGVEAVRATLDEKSRLARQHAAVESLLEADVRPEQVVSLRRSDLDFAPTRAGDDRGERDRGLDRRDGDRRDDGSPVAVYLASRSFAVFVPARPLRRYVEKAETVGLFDDGDDRLFRSPEGDPMTADEFDLVHKRTRLARVNMSGQGSVCDALNESRRSMLDREQNAAD